MAVRKRYLPNGKKEEKGGGFLKINPFGNVAHRQKKRGWLRLFFSGIFILFFLAVAGGAAAFVYFSRDLPDPANLDKRDVTESTKIYDRTDKILIYEVHGEERRTVVPLDQISPYLKNATIAIEDKDFYTHEGVDVRGIARAIWTDIKSGNMRQGGSTITQQLIKNSILTKEKTASRKIKEWILAIELEQKFTKDQIIEMYLNQIPYGSNAYGAEAASQTFFKKQAKDLTLGESAILAAMPQAPTRYSPYGTSRDKLQERADYVLTRMEELGYIKHDEAVAARDENALEKITPFREQMTAPHFVMMVREYLAETYGEKTLEKGGLRVVTSLDVEKQKTAEEIVKASVEKNNKKYNVNNAALVAVDPKSGDLLALVGSKDYYGESSPAGCVSGKNCKFDPNVNAAAASLPPGSSFKPFVYATLFKKGFTPNSIFYDVDTEFNVGCTPDHQPNAPYVKASDCYDPQNYDGKFRGAISIRSALAQSLNIPAVKAFYIAGIDNSIQLANDFGMTTMSKKDKYGLALVLGGGGVKLMEQTGAYGVFANEGVKNDLRMVLKVTATDGTVLEDKGAVNTGKEVLDKNIAREITDVLSDNAARAPMFGAVNPLYFPDRPVAAKTGTANDYRDAWTFGYTPSLAVGVWAGNNDYSPMTRAGGVSAAAPIWNEFMAKVLDGSPVESFTKPEIPATGKPVLDGIPDGGVTVKLDKACGDDLAKPDLSPDRIIEKTYKSFHNILFYIDPAAPLGAAPIMPENDPQYKNWEAAVVGWAALNGFVNETVPTEYCQIPDTEKSNILIISPRDGEVVAPASGSGNGSYNLKVEAGVYVPAGVTQVNFFFDDSLIGTRSSEPWVVNYPIGKNISDGEHRITVKAYDISGNETKTEIKITLSADFEPPTVSMRSPLCSRTACFLSADASDDKSGIASVEFYYKKGGSNAAIAINGNVTSDSGYYQLLWPVDNMEMGSYDIWAKATDKQGNETVSEKKKITI